MREAMTAIVRHDDAQPATPVATVTIVSDVLLYRDGLSASLAVYPTISVNDSVAGDDALQSIAANSPDVVLLDGSMEDCLELARRIRASHPNIKLVGFAISGGTERMADCAESGIAAFVDCNGNVDDLVASVSDALAGRLSCSPALSATLCKRLARISAGSAKSLSLTRREQEIAALVGRGLSNKEIAIDLNIGASTVKNHVHSILEKLGVRRRSAIVSRLDREELG